MLGNNRGRKLKKYIPDYVVFDLETTGVSSVCDEVIEISGVKVKGGQVMDEFTSLVNPRRSIPFGASKVNGITDDMVRNAPFFTDVLTDFLAFVGDDVLVGHNIHSFDMHFIYRDAERYYGKIPGNDYVDTLYVARDCLPQLAHHRLSDLASFYGISTRGAHRALNDCRMNQMVFERLAKEMEAAEKGKTEWKVCSKCGHIMKVRNGRYGQFWGCSGYPRCRYTENIR